MEDPVYLATASPINIHKAHLSANNAILSFYISSVCQFQSIWGV